MRCSIFHRNTYFYPWYRFQSRCCYLINKLQIKRNKRKFQLELQRSLPTSFTLPEGNFNPILIISKKEWFYYHSIAETSCNIYYHEMAFHLNCSSKFIFSLYSITRHLVLSMPNSITIVQLGKVWSPAYHVFRQKQITSFSFHPVDCSSVQCFEICPSLDVL